MAEAHIFQLKIQCRQMENTNMGDDTENNIEFLVRKEFLKLSDNFPCWPNESLLNVIHTWSMNKKNIRSHLPHSPFKGGNIPDQVKQNKNLASTRVLMTN